MPMLMWIAAMTTLAAAAFYTQNEYLLPIGLLGVIAMRFVLTNPNWALAALIASPNVQYGVWLSPVKIATAVVLPLLLWSGMRRKQTMLAGGGWFAAIVIATMAWQVAVDVGLGYLDDPVALAPIAGLLATMLAMWKSIFDLRFLVAHSIIQTFALLLLGATMPFFVSTAEMQAEVTRHGGLAGQPNLLATSLSRTTVFAVALLVGRHYGIVLRAVAVAALAGGVYAQFAANSRSGVLSFIGGATALALLGAEGLPRRLAVILAVVGISTMGIVLAPYSYRERALSVFEFADATNADRARIDEMTSGRATLNARAIAIIESNPLIGIGSSGFQRTAGGGTAVHNAFLAVGAGAGVLAMLAVATAVVGALAVGVRAVLRTEHYRVEAAATVACAFAGLIDMLSSPIFMTLQNLWAFMLCAQLPTLVAKSKRQQMDATTPEPARQATLSHLPSAREPLAARKA